MYSSFFMRERERESCEGLWEEGTRGYMGRGLSDCGFVGFVRRSGFPRGDSRVVSWKEVLGC